MDNEVTNYKWKVVLRREKELRDKKGLGGKQHGIERSQMQYFSKEEKVGEGDREGRTLGLAGTN